MAIQIIKCPNCGGEVQMDDSLEKGYCMFCGGAIQIQEEITKIQVEHSGKIEIDDSKKRNNSIELADRAFAAGNYEECYQYCCAALECDIYNAHITLRKGLSAAYLSTSRIGELEQALLMAEDIIYSSSEDPDRDIHTIFTELMAYIKAAYVLHFDRARGFVYPNFGATDNAFDLLLALSRLCADAVGLITNDMIADHPTYEADKKACLELALEISAEGLEGVKYFAGYRQVKKGDSIVQQEVYETTQSPFRETHLQDQLRFKEEYNNLPTTKRMLAEFDTEMAKLQKDVDVFTKRLEEYLTVRPDLNKEYKKNAKVPGILTVVALFAWAIGAALLSTTISGLWFTVVVVLLSAVVIAPLVWTIRVWLRCRKTRKRILSQLPPDLAAMKETHDQSKSKLQSLAQAKAAFVRKNIKK